MARLLFVTWNDSPLAAQFSVPPDCTLRKITSEPVVLNDHSELASDQNAEFMLDASRVRVAYMVDVPDGVMVNLIEPVDVESPIGELDRMLEGETADVTHSHADHVE